MTPQSCNGCQHYRASTVYGDACFRAKRFMDGRRIEAPVKVGFPAKFETGPHMIYGGRDPDDHCGPTRRNFRAAHVEGKA